jgi:transketolase C-terminal domain/subunit
LPAGSCAGERGGARAAREAGIDAELINIPPSSHRSASASSAPQKDRCVVTAENHSTSRTVFRVAEVLSATARP